MVLSQLKVGETRKVKAVATSLGSQFRKKLLAMGLRPQNDVTLVRKAPLGDPLQIETDGMRLAIRGELAKNIELY